ncbi:hypothetical protein BCJMU51_0913 [Bacillus cereus]|nr:MULTISPECIES: hypothetical protein [Bacillus cereus group]MCU5326260.1 hypothetical protein [Bacillus cereus]BCB36043.1 hypothetical protein BCM0045_0938 [Bacillus cereus]BCB98855.1 hypothetical protein BCM0057_0938 [Bacillus cereus]BCC22351.1 hypothetical protein BCM0079_0944 [Bacillus cereus]BCC33959.1 hypothetical protein BCM0105_0949 [Bacillus cereus]
MLIGFIFLISFTFKKVYKTKNVLKITLPIEKVQSFIEKNERSIIIFFDEFTCVETLSKMDQYIKIIRKRSLPFAIVNVMEGVDPEGDRCLSCPITSKYNIEVVPSVVYFENGEKIRELVNDSDKLTVTELEQFVGSIDIKKTYSLVGEGG